MKITVNQIITLLIAGTLALQGCDDFIEKDIESEQILLLAPANNLTTTQLTHTFWWDLLKGAELYNMQIVEGTFSSVTNFVLDTTISKNKFDYTLYPGSFQWRVKGINNGSETYYSTFTLTIDSSLDISNQQVILSSPADNSITNNDNLSFSWNALLNADDYLIEIHEGSWTGNLVFGPQLVTSTGYSTTLPEGVLVWGVQARNSTSNTSTAFSTRTLTIDTTSPEIVTLVSPADNATLNDVYNTYSWTQGNNTGTALTEDIFFYSDAGATALVKTATASATSYQDSLGTGTYYWRVQSTDAAGNTGPMSIIRKVTIQ
ncbi:MAG: hypothetical protein KDD41_03935 [Flavobacteriales bacterium]|nr:hypothetical protein [Flavobacteriales bacterium]